jgi:hypothetical protein
MEDYYSGNVLGGGNNRIPLADADARGSVRFAGDVVP